ncbi:winged helix-turn-helix transcriptional regulator [Anaerovoracaceae bacterium Sow4_D4]
MHENKRRTSGLPGGNSSGTCRWQMETFDYMKLESAPVEIHELQRDLEGISQKVLTDSLRQMMDDGLVHRHDYQEMPPRVDYSLTELGKKLLPIIDALADFGNYYKSVTAE